MLLAKTGYLGSTMDTRMSTECKWAVADLRRSSERKRSSVKPHDPEPKADSDPTVGIPASSGGKELGSEGEAKIADEDKAKADPPDEPDDS